SSQRRLGFSRRSWLPRRRRREEMAGGGGGGAAPAPKQEELQPHPVKDQLPNVSYCITSPPPWREFFHIFLAAKTDEKARVVQTILFVAGINTLFQTLFGTRLPAVIGGSYTFVAPTVSIVLAGRYSYIVDPHEVARTPTCVPLTLVLQNSLILSRYHAEIFACNAWNTGCPDRSFNTSDHHWFQRSMAKRRQASDDSFSFAIVFVCYFVTCPRFIKLGLQVAKCIEIGFPQIILLVIFSQVLLKCLLTFLDAFVLHILI
ncbi:hypothetical protein B296_00015908, partial [Ensete ventricosum]